MISTNDDILPPHPIVELPLSREVLIYGGLMTLLAALLGALIIWWFWLRYRRIQGIETPFEQVIRLLSEVWERSKEMSDREFAFEASTYVRNYLEKALNLPAPERTTEEFLASLNQYEIFRSHDIAYLLKQILEKCDEAKFAKRKLTVSEKEKLYKCAVDLLKQLHQKTQPTSDDQQEVKTQRSVKVMSSIVPSPVTITQSSSSSNFQSSATDKLKKY